MLTTDMTGSTMPLRLADKEFQMAPLSDLDIAELDQWLRARVFQIAIDSTPKDADEQTRRLIMESAQSVAVELTWMSPEGAKQMRTLDGMSRLIWQSIKERHPEITHADVRKMMMDPRTVDEAFSTFDLLNNSGEPSKKKNRSGKRKAGRRQQQRKGRR